jgi:hypothetical protein
MAERHRRDDVTAFGGVNASCHWLMAKCRTGDELLDVVVLLA